MSQLLQQETQLAAAIPADILDNIAPSEANYETNAVSGLDSLNAIFSRLNSLLDNQSGNWYDALVVPAALEAGTARGVNSLNTGLHAVEKKRILRDVHSLADITVGAGNNFVILGAGELPAQTTAAVGAVTTLGTVVATHGGTFGTHDLSEVAGANAINPKNLVAVFDGASRDPILSSGRTVYGLLHGESGLTDGGTITDATTTRVQISFVRVNATGDGLEAVPATDIENQVINYCYRERVRLEDLNEQDFLKGAIVDTPAGTVVTRQAANDGQGATPVDQTTNAILDLEGPGLQWVIRDDLEAPIFRVTEGSAGGTTEVAILGNIFNSQAAVNQMDNGLTVDVDSNGLELGVTSGLIRSQSGDLEIEGAANLILDDGNRTGSTSGPLPLSASLAEWDALDAAFTATTLAGMLTEAKNSTARTRIYSQATTANVNAGTDISGPANDNNVDTDFGDLSVGTFTDDYDWYLNGQYLRIDAAVGGPGDIYPGTALASGQIRLNKKLKNGDTLTVVKYV